MWKRMAVDYPKKVLETIVDPKSQVENIQQQVNQMGENLGWRLDIDDWRQASKADYKKMTQTMEQIIQSLNALNQKVDKLADK